MHTNATCTQPDLEAPWVSKLRKEMIDEGHDAGRVDQLIEASLEQLGSGRVHDFVPVLVERSPKPNAPEGASRCRAWTSSLAGWSAAQGLALPIYGR